jgi:hypothetical protein
MVVYRKRIPWMARLHETPVPSRADGGFGPQQKVPASSHEAEPALQGPVIYLLRTLFIFEAGYGLPQEAGYGLPQRDTLHTH